LFAASLDPNAPEEPDEDSKSKKTGAATEYTKQLQHLIVDAVSNFALIHDMLS
jgi:hypothetical protein